MRTPTPPKIEYTANLDFLDKRTVSDALDEINANKFVQKTFNSTGNADEIKDKESDVLKVKGELKVNKMDADGDDPLFHKNVRN